MTARRVVLVGGGHAHLEVLRAAARRAFAAELVLVSPFPQQRYTGMLPAELRAAAPAGELSFDLRALCRAAGARFVEAAADRVDADARGGEVRAGGATLAGDAISLDVGARAAALDGTPGAAAFAIPVRPLDRWEALVARTEALLADGDRRALHACVVGGGAGGVEIALALHARALAAGREPRVLIVDAGRLLAQWSDAPAARVRALLEARGIRLRESAPVAAVDAGSVRLADGTRIDADLVVWATGAAAPRWLRDSALPVDDDGWLRVDATLRAVDGRAVWGAGDCVTLEDSPWVPKAGVYAVREAPVLAHNLRAAVDGGPPRRYAPQRDALAILDTGDGRALARWRMLALHATWAWWLKRLIDRRFVARYQRLYA